MEDEEIKSQNGRSMDGSEALTFRSSCIEMVRCRKFCLLVDDKHKDFTERCSGFYRRRSWEVNLPQF